jgi:hypothetical protein
MLLLNRIAKYFCIFPNSAVPADDRHKRRRLPEELRRRKVDGIERANGFDGERPPDAREHGVCHAYDVAATLKPPQCLYRRTLLLGSQPSGYSGTKDGSGSFRERQCGCDPAPPRPNGDACVCVPFEKRSDQSAGLDVSNAIPRARLSRCFCRWRAPPARFPATLRHGRRRSVPQRFPRGAQYPASPP